MEKLKTTTLIVLVALSLIQSYFLVYHMPGLGAAVRSEQDYVNAEPIGKSATVESLIFPERIVIHRGDNEHTIIDPGTQFYDMILKQRIAGREFKGFQRTPAAMINWNEVRQNDIGLELHFSNGIAVELLQKLMKLEGDIGFQNEKIDRIWIYKASDTDEVRAFFFSHDGKMVYESVRADLTVRDVQDYVGFGQYLPAYEVTGDGLYIPVDPIQATEMIFAYDSYTPEQMQRSLFVDPSTTLAVEDRSGSLLFTDGKRGLQIEQNGKWINFTNSTATQTSNPNVSESVFTAVEFVNQHGGWDGTYRLNHSTNPTDKNISFRKYVEQYPVIDTAPFRYGYMRLTLQQGDVTEYVRSLITLEDKAEERKARLLPGRELLLNKLGQYERRAEIRTLFPALKALPIDGERMQFVPVWAVRLKDGTEAVLTEAYPAGFVPVTKPPVNEEGSADHLEAGQSDR